MKEPIISIIVPSYNRANYIGQLIECIQAQSYQNYELLIIDDGSKDDTRNTVYKYSNDQRIKYIYQENAERAAARNNGIRQSTGKYLAFLDSDDLWLPKHLEEGLARANILKIPALIYSLSYLSDEYGRIIGRIKMNIIEGNILEKILIQGHAGFAASAANLIDKEVFNNVGLFNEDKELTGSEDHEMWVRIARKYPVYSTHKYTALIRQHPMQTMIDPKKMEICATRADKIVFSQLNIKESSLKKKALSNRQILFAINYYSAGFNSKSRTKLLSAVKEYPGALFKWMFWWTLLRSFVPMSIAMIIRRYKYWILGIVYQKVR